MTARREVLWPCRAVRERSRAAPIRSHRFRAAVRWRGMPSAERWWRRACRRDAGAAIPSTLEKLLGQIEIAGKHRKVGPHAVAARPRTDHCALGEPARGPAVSRVHQRFDRRECQALAISRLRREPARGEEVLDRDRPRAVCHLFAGRCFELRLERFVRQSGGLDAMVQRGLGTPHDGRGCGVKERAARLRNRVVDHRAGQRVRELQPGAVVSVGELHQAGVDGAVNGARAVHRARQALTPSAAERGRRAPRRRTAGPRRRARSDGCDRR